MLKYGDDSRKIESVMACFGRGVEKHPPCSLHTVLQAAENRVNILAKIENNCVKIVNHDFITILITI